MASKNFCDICDKPAINDLDAIKSPANALNKAEGTQPERYQNNKMQVFVSWRIVNSYTDSDKPGHICAACLVEILSKHIDKLKETNGT